ncbi:MAG: alpha/beta fold hydrolase [Dehalococcoidia bacterium]|nr:alpha/beta fold hydrolase [Dehalococcoidia bacterium]
MDGLAISSAHLVGNSLGGLLALQVARDNPGRVRSLVLEDSAGLGREAAGFLRAMVLPGVGEGMARPCRGSIRRLMRILFYNPALIPSDLVEALYQERRRPGNKEALLHILRAGVTVRGVKPAMVLKDQLSSLSVPTLVMWGRQDRVFPVAHGEEAARCLPLGRLHVFEECGHWPHIERQKEFDRVLVDFLVVQEARWSQAGGSALSRG